MKIPLRAIFQRVGAREHAGWRPPLVFVQPQILLYQTYNNYAQGAFTCFVKLDHQLLLKFEFFTYFYLADKKEISIRYQSLRLNSRK